VVLNGIEEIASRPDLVDRAVTLTLKAIPSTSRRTEGEFGASFQEAHPYILGGLLDAVVGGLHAAPSTRIAMLPRMADFALWATACESGLKLPQGSFLAAYARNRAESNTAAIEAAVIGPYLMELMAERPDGGWSGTATELLDEINRLAPDTVSKQRSWSKRANHLTGKLRSIAPNLVPKELKSPKNGLAGGEPSQSPAAKFLRMSPQKTVIIVIPSQSQA